MSDLDEFICERCHRHTIRLEAALRIFNTGSCGCGGRLTSVENLRIARTAVRAAGDYAKKLTGRRNP